MFKYPRSKTPPALFILAGLYLLNAVGTTTMYLRTLPLTTPSTFDPLTLRAYAVADFPFSIIPGFAVASSLWRFRHWSWVLALMLNAVYFHSMTVLLFENLFTGKGSPFGEPMTPVSIYFLIFGALSTIYLIAKRDRFPIYENLRPESRR